MSPVSMRLDNGWEAFSRNLTTAMLQRLPDAKREMFRAVGNVARELILDRYETFIPIGFQMPAAYRGEYGDGIRITYAVGPKLSYLTISNVAANAKFVEGGRGPGEQPPIDALVDWAEEKLGIDTSSEFRVIKRGKHKGEELEVAGPGMRRVWAIAKRIARQGSYPHNLMRLSLGKGTPGGQAYQHEIQYQLQIMMNKVLGRRSS